MKASPETESLDAIVHDDRVEAVWPRYVTADDQLLPTIHAVFDPRAGALPWLIKAVFTLPDNAFELLLTDSGKHISGRGLELFRDEDARRPQLQKEFHQVTSFGQLQPGTETSCEIL